MASAFGWPVRVNGQCAAYSKVLTIILYILFDLQHKTAECNNNHNTTYNHYTISILTLGFKTIAPKILAHTTCINN